MNVEVRDAGLVQDDLDTITDMVSSLLEESDMVITTGGASVGDYDWALRSAEKMGARYFRLEDLDADQFAEGVKAGGKLAASVRKLKVKAVHTAIPERLDIDVTNLELGKTIKVGELSFEGLELVTSPSVVVCQVKMTRNARSAAAAEEAQA